MEIAELAIEKMKEIEEKAKEDHLYFLANDRDAIELLEKRALIITNNICPDCGSGLTCREVGFLWRRKSIKVCKIHGAVND